MREGVIMADELKPGDVGWTHPHVKGDTNPQSIKALHDALMKHDRQERDRVLLERVQHKW